MIARPPGPFDQRDQAMGRSAAHDGIALPVAQLAALLDRRGTLGDVRLTQQDTACRPAAIALAADLGHDPGIAIERSTAALVVAQAPIDRLVARHSQPASPEAADDLFRTPEPFQCSLDPTLHLRTEPQPAPAAAPACQRIPVSLAGSVAPIVGCRIAPQLAADRARRTPQQSGNLSLVHARHAMGRNAISFFLGELVIRHGCNPFLPEKVAASITAHPLIAGGVALSM